MKSEPIAIEDSPIQRFELLASRDRIKRLILAALLIILTISFAALTLARYAGQGLTPHYFRLSTPSDILSALTYLVTLFGVVRMLRSPRRVGQWQLLVSIIYALIIMWIVLGIQRYDATDFPPLSSVALLGGLFGQMALVLTRGPRSYREGGTEDATRQSRPPFLRFLIRAIRNTFFIYFVYIVIGFGFNLVYPAYTTPEEIALFNADAGIVFGAAVWSGNQLGNRPSPTLRERIEVGYQLLTNKAIPRLVVTGASAPGEETEANVARQEMIKRGVDPSAIITEAASHTTFEQVRFIREELIKKQRWSKFVVISDQYHLARILQMCRFNGIRVIATPSEIHQPFLDLLYYRFRESVALLAYWLLGK